MSTRVPCIDGLDIVTLTPGKIAPVVSVIWPLIAPVVALTICADAVDAKTTRSGARTKPGMHRRSDPIRLLYDVRFSGNQPRIIHSEEQLPRQMHQCAGGTSRFSSSNQFSTTTTRGSEDPCGRLAALIIR